MRPTRIARSITVAIILAALAACSKSSKPTSPYGGGTGGTGGTSFSHGPFQAGQSAQRTFTAAANVGYHCAPHQSSGMVGTVQVDAMGSDSQVVSIGPANTLTFSPSPAHIKPNGYVRWVNVSAMTNHTVTSD